MRKVNRLVAGTMLAACVGVANAGTPEILNAVAYRPMTGQEMESVSRKINFFHVLNNAKFNNNIAARTNSLGSGRAAAGDVTAVVVRPPNTRPPVHTQSPLPRDPEIRRLLQDLLDDLLGIAPATTVIRSIKGSLPRT